MIHAIQVLGPDYYGVVFVLLLGESLLEGSALLEQLPLGILAYLVFVDPHLDHVLVAGHVPPLGGQTEPV
jgi:hypothetical protein